MIISLYAGGMTIRDIEHHLATTIGTEISRETISKITDAVLDEVGSGRNARLRSSTRSFISTPWSSRSVMVTRSERAAHIAVGVDLDGIRHVLGIWVTANEGAKFWAGVCAELANRGVKDILIVCTDGLTGFAEAVEATWPQTTVQTCVVHLIRNSMRFVSYGERKAIAAALKTIYTAPTVDAAAEAFEEFANSALGQPNPTTVVAWRNAWERFIPFLAFPPELRRIIYTTNAIESLNYQLRKIIKNRGHFPSDQAAVKLLWLAICNIEDKRARERQKFYQDPLKTGDRSRSKRLVEGARTNGWKQALGALALTYPERLNPYL